MAESLEERCGAVLQTRDLDDGFPQYECTHPAGHHCAHAGPRASWTDAEHWIPCEVEEAIERRVRAEERQRSAALEEAAMALVLACDEERYRDAMDGIEERIILDLPARFWDEFIASDGLGKQKAAP